MKAFRIIRNIVLTLVPLAAGFLTVGWAMNNNDPGFVIVAGVFSMLNCGMVWWMLPIDPDATEAR